MIVRVTTHNGESQYHENVDVKVGKSLLLVIDEYKGIFAYPLAMTTFQLEAEDDADIVSLNDIASAAP